MKCPKCSNKFWHRPCGKTGETSCIICGNLKPKFQMNVVMPFIPPPDRKLSDDPICIRARENAAKRKAFKKTINSVQVVKV